MTRKSIILLILLGFVGLISPPKVIAADVPEAFHSTALELPRFASLEADEVYVRSGPGLKYPIKWVYKKPGLPVEIILEFEVWRKIHDVEGKEGWVHSSLLSGRRTGIIQRPPETEEDKKLQAMKDTMAAVEKEKKTGILGKGANTSEKPEDTTLVGPEPVPAYQKPRENARWVAQLMPGAIADLDECATGWCLVRAEGYHGWVQRKYIWGLYDDEDFK